MIYAVIESGSKQYKVRAGDTVYVDRIQRNEGEEYAFPHVLLARINDDVFIGQPYVNNVKVIGKILGGVKGDKIRVSKFKAKVRYRKVIGFRPYFTKVSIEKIDVLSSAKSARTKKS